MNMIFVSVLNSPMQNAHARDGLAIYIQLNGRVSVLMPPYSAVSHAMQINCKSKMSTNIDIILANTALTHINLYVYVYAYISWLNIYTGVDTRTPGHAHT
jgi:hypothetical protein